MLNERLYRMARKTIAEGKRLLWIFLYLWVLLGLFALYKSMILNDRNILFHQGFAIVNALVLAKVMFAADAFHLADRLKNRPLIFPIVFRSIVFSILLITFYVIEEVATGALHGKSFSASVPDLGGGGLQGMLVASVIMFVALMPFFALREIARDVGDDKLYQQFFTRRSRYVLL